MADPAFSYPEDATSQRRTGDDGRQFPEPVHAINRWDTCGKAWLALLRHVWTRGRAGLDDRGPLLEAPPVSFEITGLAADDPVLRRHGRPPAGDGGKDGEKDPLSPRLRELQGVDQLAWVVDVLAARPWSTRCWISLTVPGEDPAAIPYLTALSFRVVSWKLAVTAVFRAQDVVTAPPAYLRLAAVRREVAERLGLAPGPLRVYVDVPLMYIGDSDEVAAILTEPPADAA